MKKLLSIVLAMTAFSATATEFNVGTGGEKGNYYDMMNDIKSYCSDQIGDNSLNVLPSGGSSDNLTGMMNKEYALGIVQTDVLYYFKRQMPNKVNENSINVVAGLHNEFIHILIPRDYKPESDGGWWSKLSFGGDEPQQLDLNLLKNQKVAAWGGSILSAKALSAYLGLNFNVIDVPENKRSKIDMPIIIVGGQPYSIVQDYLKTGNYNLVALDYASISQSATYYQPGMLSYNINGKLKSVPTVSVQALLVGKSFRKESRNKPMSDLATCVNENIADLADDPETNPNWASVYDFFNNGGQTSWKMFPINE